MKKSFDNQNRTCFYCVFKEDSILSNSCRKCYWEKEHFNFSRNRLKKYILDDIEKLSPPEIAILYKFIRTKLIVNMKNK